MYWARSGLGGAALRQAWRRIFARSATVEKGPGGLPVYCFCVKSNRDGWFCHYTYVLYAAAPYA